MVTSDGAGVTAVRCEHSDGKTEDLPADLVIDASGHALLTLTLLQSLGQPPPEVAEQLSDEQYVRSVVEVLYKASTPQLQTALPRVI